MSSLSFKSVTSPPDETKSLFRKKKCFVIGSEFQLSRRKRKSSSNARNWLPRKSRLALIQLYWKAQTDLFRGARKNAEYDIWSNFLEKTGDFYEAGPGSAWGSCNATLIGVHASEVQISLEMVAIDEIWTLSSPGGQWLPFRLVLLSDSDQNGLKFNFVK